MQAVLPVLLVMFAVSTRWKPHIFWSGYAADMCCTSVCSLLSKAYYCCQWSCCSCCFYDQVKSPILKWVCNWNSTPLNSPVIWVCCYLWWWCYCCCFCCCCRCYCYFIIMDLLTVVGPLSLTCPHDTLFRCTSGNSLLAVEAGGLSLYMNEIDWFF